MIPLPGVMLIGIVAVSQKAGGVEVKQFTTSVTWVMGASLTLTGLLQLVFTRFIADRLFEGKDHIINPNLFGAIMLTSVSSLVIGILLAFTIFHESLAYEVLMIANFVTLSNIWILVIFVAGLKRFKLILVAFGVGYGATVVFSVLLMKFGLNGLLCGLLAGHGVLLFMLLAVIIPEYPVVHGVKTDFLQRKQIFPILIFIGFFYNLGIWADKLIFWLYPEGFFNAVRGNASLQEIESLGNEMVVAVREGIFQIIRIQGITVLVLYLMGPKIVEWLGISDKFVHLYYIDLVGVAAQVLMLAVLNVTFYLDKLRDALILTTTLLVSNTVFTLITIQLGPQYYGYGFGLSMTLTAFVGMLLVSNEMDNIEFRTFMRERHVEELPGQ